MDWKKITFVGSAAPAAYDAFRNAFVEVWLPISGRDCYAMYSTDTDVSPVTVYLSPLAAELACRAMPEFVLEPSGFPPTDVWLSVGMPIASDPAWCELPEEVRVAARAERDLAWEEAENVDDDEDFTTLGRYRAA